MTTCPRREHLRSVLEHTAAIASCVASLLDGLDRLSRSDGVEAEFDTCRAGVGALVMELSTFYGDLVAIDNALTKRRAPKSFVWRQTMELWISFVYLGGTHASGGLLSRLDRIQHVPVVPWDGEDIVGLRRIADRARFLVTAPAEDLEDERRRVWCEGVDGWLRADARALAAGTSIMAGWVDEAPETHPEVIERLRTIAHHEAIAEDVRRKALAKIRAPRCESFGP